MLNNLSFFIISFVFVLLFSSCGISSRIETQPNKKLSLSEDPIFREYIENTIFISNTLAKPELLTGIYSDRKIDKNEIDDFVKLVGFKSRAAYSSYVTEQNKKLLLIMKTHNLKTNSSSQLKTEIEKEIKKFVRPDFAGLMGPCEDEQINGYVINAAAATVGHISCLAADVTVFLGIVCHAAVTTAHIAADSNVDINYNRCLKNN